MVCVVLNHLVPIYIVKLDQQFDCDYISFSIIISSHFETSSVFDLSLD